MAQTGHKNSDVAMRYVQRGKILQTPRRRRSGYEPRHPGGGVERLLGISESEYVARFTSVTHTDWVMRCTARKVPRAAEQEPVVLPPSKRAA